MCMYDSIQAKKSNVRLRTQAFQIFASRKQKFYFWT